MATQLSPRVAARIVHFAEYRRQQILGNLIGSVLGSFWCWAFRWQSRQALADIIEDRHLLADIGMTREQALLEASKPFWRA